MWLVLSLAGFALAVLLHAGFTRMGGSLTIVLSFLIVGIPLTVLIAAVALWMFAISDESIAAILVYLALCETYGPDGGERLLRGAEATPTPLCEAADAAYLRSQAGEWNRDDRSRVIRPNEKAGTGRAP